MKSLKIIGTFLVLLSAVGFIMYMNIPKDKNVSENNKSATNTGCSINSKSQSCGAETVSGESVNEVKDNIFVLGTLSKTGDLIGKPSFLRWAGKFCAYCREKIPQVENLIQKEFGDKINLQIMTMNFESAKFSTSIPQTPYGTFNYKDFTNETCDEFPTWVILDKNNNLIAKECGGKTTIEKVSKEISSLVE